MGMVRGLSRERAFTLAEALMVLASIAVIIAIVVGSFFYSKIAGVEIADRTNLRDLRSAIAKYRLHSPTTTFPSLLDDLYPKYISDRSVLTEPEKHLAYVYDPMTGSIYDPLHPDR
jgi:type II secretory pathway pseudopilin PulG